jgi:hypothetical protein
MSAIDTSFIFTSETPAGKDADSYSPTLRRYHKLLWSKPLPDGSRFNLSDQETGKYLYHNSVKGEFWLSSDTIGHSYSRVKIKKLLPIISQVAPSDLDSFRNLVQTIGGKLIFPSKCIDRKPTINAGRGIHYQIKDRFDLTLECIRLYYQNQNSPLAETLERYADFFRLFGDFRGYVEFFLLQDLVSSDYTTINFWMPFEGFEHSPLPADKERYLEYRKHCMAFLEARNQRIRAYCLDHNI